MSNVVDLAISAVSRISSFYQDINPSTLSGAIDIIIVKQSSGELLSSPFHVRFGKLKLLQPSDKVVEIRVNNIKQDIVMKVGEAGEAFFVVPGDGQVPKELQTSPILVAARDSDVETLQLENYPGLPSTDTVLDNPAGTMDDSIIDTTLDTNDPALANLHIQESMESSNYENEESQSFDAGPPSYSPYSLARHTLDTPSHKHSHSVTIDSKTSTSPPWSWQWGGLPEREDRIERHKLSHMASTPLMSGEENGKVDKILASIHPPPAVTMPVQAVSSSSSPTRVSKKKSKLARDQDLNDIKVCEEIVKLGTIQVSLAGPLDEFSKADVDAQKSLFDSNVLDRDRYLTNPLILSSPTVIVEINGFYHNWDTACQIIMSNSIFGKEMDQQTLLKIFKKSKQGWFSWTKAEIASSPPLTISKPEIKQTQKHYAKSLRLNSEQLKSFNLKPGCNTITFSVHTPLQGLATCNAHIFLWDHTAKIIISDVDGTITKSDVLGHVFNMVGRDWTHPGVASLYTAISTNGYEFLYLTSRAIGQASSTRDYLAKVAQDTSTLPLGPLLLSPARLIQALRREVIERRPQEFKMSCLKDIKKLFGGRDPFFAGFGNRITDAMSYRSVGIPSSRIFTIDPNGVVQLELLANYVTSYTKLRETVDQVFPPTVVDDEYNDFKFWKNDDYSNVKIDIPEVVYSDSDDSEEQDVNLKSQLAAMKHASY